jgi:nitrite reductase/ring-hydroxylating ferredoxin subunit
MSNLIKVAEVSDLQAGECKTVVADGRELALANIEGKFYAVDNVCPHQGGPLGEGIIEGRQIVCPWHGWRFDCTTGQCGPIPTLKVDAFECVVEGSDVKVKLS